MSRRHKANEPVHPRPAVYLLKHVQSELQSSIEEALAPQELTAAQVAIMSVLRSVPGLSNADLARATFVKPQSVIPLLISLEKRKFIIRHRSPSGGRSMPATLTSEGVAQLKAGWVAVKAVEDRMLEDLSMKEQLRLRKLLEHCLACLRPVQ